MCIYFYLYDTFWINQRGYFDSCCWSSCYQYRFITFQVSLQKEMGCSKLERIPSSAFVTLVLSILCFLAEREREWSMPSAEGHKKLNCKTGLFQACAYSGFSDLAWCSTGTSYVYKCNALTKRQPCAKLQVWKCMSFSAEQLKYFFNRDKTKGFFHNFVLENSWDFWLSYQKKKIQLEGNTWHGDFSQNS